MRPLDALQGLARPPWPLLLGIAAVGQVAALMQPDRASLTVICGDPIRFLAADPANAIVLFVAFNGFGAPVAAWATMLAVMMPPLLGWPLTHVWRSSLPARRPRAMGIFLIAYGAVWMAAGLPLVGGTLLIRLIADAGGGAAAFALLSALIWSASPWQRLVLNRGHRLMRIGVRGWKADRDALTFGGAHGGWCVLSCWPWMLAPMLAGAWHVPAMVVATVAMFTERLGPPGSPRWRMPTILVLAAFLLTTQHRRRDPYA